MKIETVQQHLSWLGFGTMIDGDLGSKTKQNLMNFQRGFAYWDLVIDGLPGPETAKALVHAASAPKRAEGTASPHFSFGEFTCKCNGRYATCERIKADRDTVRGLEVYRESLGGVGIGIVSGYRCPSHNRRVGGATQSRHLTGDAVDITPVQARTATKKLAVFTGIGYQGTTGKTRHVDTRGGDVLNPVMWVY